MPFCLISEPWIPALDAEGERHWIAPHQITEPDGKGGLRWRDLDWGRPDLRIASYELLIGLFAVALAPDSRTGWQRLLETPPSPEQLGAALAPLARYVQLDGDGPRFLQDMAEINGKANPPDELFLDAPGANTIEIGKDFFVKRGRTPVLSRKAAAIALFALQAFATSGGQGHLVSMRGGGPLTALVVPRGADLWRRIAANLPLLTEASRRVPDDLTLVFPWTRPTRLSRDNVTTGIDLSHGTHWLQHYFGMPRRIRLDLVPNSDSLPCALTGAIDAVVATGFRMDAYGINYLGWTHPLTPHYEDKSGQRLPIHPQSGRIAYRDWIGYLFAGGGSGPKNYPSESVTAYAETARRLGTLPAAGLLVAGYVTDNMKTEDYVEAEVPLIIAPASVETEVLDAEIRGRLVGGAETVARELRGALITSLGGDYKKTPIAAAIEQFWIETEAPFREALEGSLNCLAALPEDEEIAPALEPVRRAWANALRETALGLFRSHVSLDTLADMPASRCAAIVQANRFLHLALHGYGKSGQALFAQLGLPPVAPPATSKQPKIAGARA